MTSSQSLVSEVKKYKYSENAFLPRMVVIPLTQEKKCLCKSLVFPGDIVKEGDVIAESENSVGSAKIHSPVPGKVIDFVSVLCPNGRYEKAVRIQLAGSFIYTGKPDSHKDWHYLSSSELINKFACDGLLNTFITGKPISLSAQISSLKNKDCSLVVRLFDDDCFRLADSLLSKFYFNQILEGAKITASALNAKRIVFVMDEKAPFDESKIEQDKINIIFLKMNISKYPAGFKHKIITAFKKTYRKQQQLPLYMEDLFVDSYTMYAVYNSIVCNQPVISNYVHFSGNCIPVSSFLKIKTGFLIKDIIEQLGGFVHQPSLIVINGRICGNAVNSLEVPVTKEVKSIEFISKIHKTDYHIYNCIDCGNCVNVCSVGLAPDLLYKYAVNNLKLSQVQINSAVRCSGCNLCNTVCPSRLPLSQTIGVLKNKIMENEDEK
jgi:electron transport complex protein RnfC